MKTNLISFIIMMLLISYSLISFSQPGELDTTFGGTGIVIFNPNYYEDYAKEIAVQPDSKIIVAGFSADSTSYNYDFSILRFLPNGNVDSSFDNDGITIIPFGLADDQVEAVVIQPDGKIVVVGYSFYSYGGTGIAVLRLNPDGSIDSTFGADGKVFKNYDGYSTLGLSVALQNDGKIVVAGHRKDDSGYYSEHYSDIIVIRLNDDGSFDPSFNNSGILLLDFSNYDYAYTCLVQPDGKIILAGSIDIIGQPDVAILQLNPDGVLDTAFASNGMATVDFGGDIEYASDALLQPDGRIVASVSYESYNGPFPDFAAVRFNIDGTLDSTFSNDGILTTVFNSTFSYARSVALQLDGKIILAGAAFSLSQNDFALARYHNNGTADSTFGINGTVINDSSGDEFFYGAAIQSDGKIVAAGFTESLGNTSSFAIARYLSDCLLTVTDFVYTYSDLNYQFTDQSLNAASWHWDFGDGSSSTDQNPLHAYSLPGFYEACLIAGNVCGSDTSCQIISIIADAVNDFQTPDLELIIAPNPFSATSIIQFSLSENQEVKIELFDLQGRRLTTIAEGNFEAGDYHFSLEAGNLEAGVYFLQLKTSSSTSTEKLVIE